ncbi:hypothetical protein CRG98_040544 [Punica granatum]|uniref:Uncharacterized protein n=1 Tax=Punica granatum TaxID=22663 RepID=A0A2I0I519_PUNGR|nr:hypothetical protein CRG98_040544 [Punica granatum]
MALTGPPMVGNTVSNYKYAPYVAEFSGLVLHGCMVDTIERLSRCDHDVSFRLIPTGISSKQRNRMGDIRKKHMTYSYRYDQAIIGFEGASFCCKLHSNILGKS